MSDREHGASCQCAFTLLCTKREGMHSPTWPDLESNEGLAFEYYEEKYCKCARYQLRHQAYHCKNPQIAMNTERETSLTQSTVIVATRKNTHIKATEGGAPATEYGNWVHGQQHYSPKAWRSPPRGKEGSVERSCAALRGTNQEHAVKLLNGQQPNLAACKHWLGPRTQIRARSTTPIVAEGLSDSIITTPRSILTISPHARPRN
ncbi:hypothetical protein C8F04DRAFT_1177336 [Mycena alexandri]|uniref:Uncharacterized protein n=1 Tax=Mycena alexandri TaxID=1745969 RepID=A0AAD6XDC6_9AGAR|nr:hypothetical protein C8F04DRAFT_1177336 [Mycena alexandri]